jgi:hypothetical protein
MMRVTVDMPLNLGDLGTSPDGLVAECDVVPTGDLDAPMEIYIIKASALIQGNDIDVANLLNPFIKDAIRDQAASAYNRSRAAVRAGIRHIEAWA